ncbi:hypothetical protein L6452_37747 [Arctium lappa]|uniref:Uncharacterized protein n=1 Tax=Arctium lappa TaxID=4217 RepID=A0ACB8Y315_ARCLA|nr:hypothetical protein L6452_37747 [Arctium lappa]
MFYMHMGLIILYIFGAQNFVHSCKKTPSTFRPKHSELADRRHFSDILSVRPKHSELLRLSGCCCEMRFSCMGDSEWLF